MHVVHQFNILIIKELLLIFIFNHLSPKNCCHLNTAYWKLLRNLLHFVIFTWIFLCLPNKMCCRKEKNILHFLTKRYLKNVVCPCSPILCSFISLKKSRITNYFPRMHNKLQSSNEIICCQGNYYSYTLFNFKRNVERKA